MNALKSSFPGKTCFYNWRLSAPSLVAAILLINNSDLLGSVTFSSQSDPLGQINGGLAEARMIAGDFDNDGDVDFLYQAGATAGSGFGYFRNNGNGTFTKFTNANSAGTPFQNFNFAGQQLTAGALLVVDYDNDGDVDIIDRDTTSGLSVWVNNNGNFGTGPSADPLGQINGGLAEARMIAGDFDNDGDVDFLYQAGATAGSGFGYFRNNGNGTFTKFTNANSAGTPFQNFNFSGQQLVSAALFVVDYDNDGDVDIIDRDNVGGGGNTLGVWINNNGNFGTGPAPDPLGQINGGTAESRMIAGDFDSDGDVDFLYQAGATPGSGFGFLKNNGTGVFTSGLAGSPFASFNFTGQQLLNTALFVVDYDHDGDVDIIDREGTTLGVWVQGGAGDGNPPTLSSSNPADNATGVDVNANIILTFDESVTKGTGNIRLVRTSDNLIVETIAVTSGQVTGSGSTWTINPSITLAGNTSYALRVDKGTFVDSDGAIFFGITNNSTLNFTTAMADTTPPDTTINSTPPNPSNSSSASFQFSGSDNVTPAGSLTFQAQLDGSGFSSATSPKNYTGLSDGLHIFQVRAIDAASNVDPTPASYTWTIDTTAPSVTINQDAGQMDPTGSSPINFRVVFNEPVSGFGNNDVNLSGTAGATTAIVTEISPFNGTAYKVAVSGMTASGTVVVSIPNGIATDAAGNGNATSSSTDNVVTYNAPDVTPPNVTIDQAPAQSDPTTVSPINFRVVFSEPVTGFGNSDVNLSGTAGAATAIVTEISPNNGTTYNVAVSGMTDDGTVVATVPSGVAMDAASNPNNASSSTDNTVTFQAADTPSVTDTTTLEGQQTTSGLVISRNVADGAEVTHFKITGITGGTLFKNDGATTISDGQFITVAEGNAGLKFTPNAGSYSPGSTFDFDVQASTSGADSGLGGGTATATITVNPNFDFGDAPDPTYPTLLANDGARHVVLSTGAVLYMGTAPDVEADGQPNATATGDDLATDDEDGVALPVRFEAGQTSNVIVTVTGNGGLLNAWIDWNQDGSWSADEQIATNLAVIAGANILSIMAPASATAGTSFARFRLSTQSNLLPTGFAPDGEVEDYAVEIQALTAPQITCPSDLITNIPSGDTSVSVSFAATATGSPAPTITYKLGVTPITSPHVFPVGTNVVQVTAANGVSPDATCSFNIIVNRNPVAVDDTLGTKENTSVNAPIPKLLANDSDPDGDLKSISAVSATSTNGGTVVLGAGIITYTPVNGFFGEDRFDYTLSDGRGGTDIGTVVVTVSPANAPSLNQISVTPIVGGVRLRFAGIPTQPYVFQYADSVSGPWTDLSPVLVAGTTGLIQYDDTSGATMRFYRTRVGP